MGVEGRSDAPYTRPGGVGWQVDGVNLAERPAVNYQTSTGSRWNLVDNPGAGRADVQPIVDGVVELARFLVDATQLPANVLVIAPTAPAFVGVIAQSMSIRLVAIAGAGTHPSLSLGSNASAYDNMIPQTAMSFVTPGQIRWERLPSGVVLPFVANGQELRFNRSIQTTGYTTYDLEVAVFGQAIAP